MKKVFIIILNFNGGKNTIECLESIIKLQTADCRLQITVVDNGSTDNSVKEIQNSKFKIQNYNLKLKIIENKFNLGFAEGNNVGIKYALENKADFVMLLNNDTLVDQDLIKKLMETFNDDKNIGVVGPKIYFAKGHEYHHDRYKAKDLGKVIWYAGGMMDWKNVLASHRGVDEVDRGQYEKQIETDFVSGCAMMVRRKVFDKIGLLDNRYFLYFEDNDFCQRTKKSGFKIIYSPAAFLWHKNAGSAGGSGSQIQDYYTTRNRLIFGITYAPNKSKLAIIKESLKLLAGGRKWQKRGVIDFYLRKFGKGTYSI